MTVLVGFGDSQLRSSRLRYPAVAEVVNINHDTFAEAEKAKEGGQIQDRISSDRVLEVRETLQATEDELKALADQ